MNSDRNVRFGRFVLNRDRGCLQDVSGADIFLRSKSYSLFEVLVDRAGRLVSKDELAQLVWPDVIVSDDSVAHCVSDIRKALGADGARHIRTVQRRGYMFLPETGATRPASAPARQLTALRHAGLVAATAASLAAGLLVIGTPKHEPATLVAIPAEAELGPPDAVEAALLRANNLLDKRDWARRGDNEAARALLERVVAEAPDKAEAWASLGLTYWLEVQHLTWAGGRREMRRALDLVETSIRVGASPRSHRLLAEMRLLAPFAEMRSPLDALASAHAAVALDPGDPDSLAILAQVLALTGEPRQAIGLIERARRLNPNYPPWYDRVAGTSYLLAGEPARAATELEPLYEAGGLTHARSWPGWLLAASLAQSGRADEAAQVVEVALQRRPGATLDTVASSLDGFDRPQSLQTVLDGLRLAGVPG